MPGGIDNQVGRKFLAAAALLFKSHAGHRRPVGRGQQFADAAAVAQGNVCAGPQPPPDGEFDGGSRQGVVDQTEITLGKGVITRPLGAKVDIALTRTAPASTRSRSKPGKQRAERAFSADQQSMRMPGLRRARPVHRTIGKVAFEHDDLFKMIRQCPGLPPSPRSRRRSTTARRAIASQAIVSPTRCPPFVLAIVPNLPATGPSGRPGPHRGPLAAAAHPAVPAVPFSCQTSRHDQHYEVIVIGAGVAGIYQIKRLADLGVDAIVLEAGPDLGGTWYWNRYPGRALRFRELHLRLLLLEGAARRVALEGALLGPAGEPALPQLRRRQVRSAQVHAVQLQGRGGARSTRRSHLWRLHARRRPRADLPVRHSRDRAAVDADAAAAARAWTASRAARSTPSTGRTSRSNWPARRSRVIGTGATAIQVIGEIADKVGELTVFQRRPNWSAPLNNGPISDEEMADIRARYDEIFAACARTPGGFEHEPDRRGFYEVHARGAAGAVGQALRRARLRHLAEQFPRDLHGRGGQRRVLRLHRRPHPPAREGSGDGREADPEGPRLRRAAGAAGDATTSRPITATTCTSSTSARRRSSAITETGLRTTERDYEFDIIVYATGFDAITGAFDAIDITRRRRRRSWPTSGATAPSTFLGMHGRTASRTC